MLNIEDLHDKAVDFAEDGFTAKRKGDGKKAVSCFRKALGLEKEAASRFPPKKESEPTRSILYRSAAYMAYHAEDYKQAGLLAVEGLRGFPPTEVKLELEALQVSAEKASKKAEYETIMLKLVLPKADLAECNRLARLLGHKDFREYAKDKVGVLVKMVYMDSEDLDPF